MTLKSYTVRTDEESITVRTVNGPIAAYVGLTNANPRHLNWNTDGKITTITGSVVKPDGKTTPINDHHSVTELDFLAP